MHTRIVLGYLGLLPFVILTISNWVLGEDYKDISFQLLVIYGGIIISFLSGIIWGINSLNKKNLYISIGFSLLGYLAILVAFSNLVFSMCLLLILFFLFYIYESKINPLFLNTSYMSLRKNLTFGVCACYLLSIVIAIN
ncbi:MAG: hypothetical protein CMQ54_04745 [Gammaproteobacteria bacterium]|nr:hypothetical protein [Gammaproteobacteria bacterium]|tara:strand:- start:272 stop:688 length:417 start_codon:yes stop_codon:yes gene_type:complete